MNQRANISLYWKCQLTGWASASTYWALFAYLSGNFNVWLGVAYFVFDIAIGIAVTHSYYLFAHRKGWTRLNLQQLPWRIIPAILVTGVLYMALVIVKNYYVRAGFGYHEGSLTDSLRHNFLAITSTGIRLMAIWILAFHLYHYAVMQINTAHENARLMLVAKESQLSNLSAQLNPHFFFNSLNTVKALIAIDKGKARRAIDLLSDLLRSSLYGRDHLLIPLSEEIGLVNDYLELEKMRFEERLTYSVDADESLANHLLPPLSIQTLAENAIKHGIAKCTEGGQVNIKIEKAIDGINITVQNPGQMENPGSTRGLGLKNLRERLVLHYGDRASLAITGSVNGLVTSVIIIPSA